MTDESAAIAPAAEPAMVQWLFENSQELLSVIGPDGRFKLVNPAWSTTGWTEAELVGRPAASLIHPDDMADFGAHVERLTATRSSENIARVLMKDGSWRWFGARAQLTDDGSIIGFLRDATRERERERELDEARRDRDELSRAAGIGAWTYEPLEQRIRWSDEVLTLSGYQADEICTAEQFAAMLDPAEREMVQAAFVHGVRTGQPNTFEHRLLTKDGRWMCWRATFRCEPRGQGLYALKGLSQDITELADARDAAMAGEAKMAGLAQTLAQARRQAQTNARRLKMALEAAEAGVYEIDHRAETFWASPEFKAVTGRSAATYEDARDLKFPNFHPDDMAEVRGAFNAIRRGDRKSGEAFEARIVKPDGSERWVRVFHHLTIGKNGRWRRGVGLIHDFDARKRQELALIEAQRAAEAGAEAKAAFLANMSHEIRTPMNGVMGVLHLLKGETLSEEGRAMLGEAVSCGRMLAELLNDVIDFSKIEAGRLELTPEPIDPKAVVEGVARLLRPQVAGKGLSLTVDVDPAVGWVRADPVRLRQALFNLVGNAVKFTLQGGIGIRCRLVAAEAGPVLRFEVEDTGVGIPADSQARIFQRFDQGDASTTRRFGGSGLGLSITQKLARLMGGDVGFTSEAGKGSTFWLEIAVEPAQADVAAPEAVAAFLEGLRVLVVEDNATNRMIASKLLEQLGAVVETAADGLLGVEAAAHGAFDLILMDVQMPGIDGIEAARRIRELPGPVAATPIVALTANVLAHQRQAYLAAGMDGVVGKPISPAALLAEIARLGEAPAEHIEAAA